MPYDEEALIQEYRADHRRITAALVKKGVPEDVASVAAQSQIIEIQTTCNNLLQMVSLLVDENSTFKAMSENDKIMVVNRYVDEVVKIQVAKIHEYTEDIFKKAAHKAKCDMEVHISLHHNGGVL